MGECDRGSKILLPIKLKLNEKREQQFHGQKVTLTSL